MQRAGREADQPLLHTCPRHADDTDAFERAIKAASAAAFNMTSRPCGATRCPVRARRRRWCRWGPPDAACCILLDTCSRQRSLATTTPTAHAPDPLRPAPPPQIPYPRGFGNAGAAGVALFVPPGIYRITRMLAITQSNVVVRGAGVSAAARRRQQAPLFRAVPCAPSAQASVPLLRAQVDRTVLWMPYGLRQLYGNIVEWQFSGGYIK